MFHHVNAIPFVSMAQHIKNAYCSAIYRITTQRVAMVHDNQLYTEAMFRSMLVLERKRTERTQSPFLLVRVNVDKLKSGAERASAVSLVAQKIKATIRGTDLLGWISGGREMGVIISDIKPGDADKVARKIDSVVKTSLNAGLCENVAISALVFSDNVPTTTGWGCVHNAVLYDQTESGTRLAVCKRGIDIVVSIACILLFLPVLLIVPILIKLYSKGPVFFTQNRVGRHGKPFPCLKFRTMKNGNDASAHQTFMKKFIEGSVPVSTSDNQPVYKIKDDPRVTGIGKFLRKTSLDELPQFFNVLLGQMSIVGPRPAISYEVEAYDLWHRRRVLEVKPGITGIWQVEGRSRTDFNSMVRMDIRYINSWSPFLDLRLIISTPLALVTAKGAC